MKRPRTDGLGRLGLRRILGGLDRGEPDRTDEGDDELIASTVAYEPPVEERLRDEEVLAALASVDFDVEQGEFVAVLGRSGSGKSRRRANAR